MNKLFRILYCIVFFALILLPLGLIPLQGGGGAGSNVLAGNSPPVPAPVLITDGGLNLSAPQQFEDYFQNRFAGRTAMINAYNRLTATVFGVSGNEKVIAGRSGWLFFAETLGDFDGSAALGDEEMERLVSYLLELKKGFEARGQVFILAVAPNKNTLYPQYMPRGYVKSGSPGNLDRLLAVKELECIDFVSALFTAQELTGSDVYHKTDSHWNALGARAAAREIISVIEEKTGIETGFDRSGIEPGSGIGMFGTPQGFIGNSSITGDLARMLFPVNTPPEESFFYADSLKQYDTIGRFSSLDDMNINTISDGAPLTIAMYRDSFAYELIPYLSNVFQNAHYTRQTPPPVHGDAFLNADVVIFQIAERRLGELLQ